MKIFRDIYQLIKIIVSFVSWFLRQIKNENFKNYISYIEKEKTVKILGNGPSLNKVINDSQFFNTRDKVHFCVVNSCALSPLFEQIKPEHYVLADPEFFNRPIKNNQTKSLIEILLKVDWNIKLYIPFKFYNLIKDEMVSNNCIEVIPFHTNKLNNNTRQKRTKFWLYRKGLSSPRIQNVIIGCIYCMINSGYKEIKLYGIEHSWTNSLAVNDNNQVCLKDSHYYDTAEVKMEPWLKYTGEPYRLHEVLRDLAYMFEGYVELKEYAEYIGDVKIINCTPNSFIDAFDRELIEC